MNETQLSPRQTRILDLLKQGAHTRAQIQSVLTDIFRSSKVTIFRDLKILIDHGLVTTTGVGKSTMYKTSGFNPLLKVPDPMFTSSNRISFNFDVFNYLNHLLTPAEIRHIASINKTLSTQLEKLNRTIARKELERFVIELAWKSSQIEGNTYSLLETETLIKLSQEAPGHTKDEAIMILNHKAAFESIFHHKENFQSLSISHVTQLHNTLIRDLHVDPGIRKQPVGITGTNYHPLDNEHQIREALEKLVHAVNSLTHPLEKALVIACMIAYIQPFSDGNKRTSRMLANAVLMAYDFYPISYRAVSETDYKEAIIKFYEQNSIIPIKKIVLEQYEFALNHYFITNS